MPMLTRREAIAFCLAASTAPVVACLAFGSLRQFPLVATVAYVAAFVVGAPLFAYLRRRNWPAGSRSVVSATVAGVIAAVLIVTLVFSAFPPRDFLTDPGPALVIVAIAIAWGLGLGLIAGVALSVLLRRGRRVALSEA